MWPRFRRTGQGPPVTRIVDARMTVIKRVNASENQEHASANSQAEVEKRAALGRVSLDGATGDGDRPDRTCGHSPSDSGVYLRAAPPPIPVESGRSVVDDIRNSGCHRMSNVDDAVYTQ